MQHQAFLETGTYSGRTGGCTTTTIHYNNKIKKNTLSFFLSVYYDNIVNSECVLTEHSNYTSPLITHLIQQTVYLF